MTAHAVQAIWVWRFTKTPFRATYGRRPGTTYSKDFLQASSECAHALDVALGRRPREHLRLTYEWPGGTRRGSLFEAADYSENGRLDLRWETDRAPAPWRLFPGTDSSALKTFVGDPTRDTAAGADQEWDVFNARGDDPWLVVVKLAGERRRLHVRAYLGSPPPELAYTSTALLPPKVHELMDRVPLRGGCASWVAIPGRSGRDNQPYFNPMVVHQAWTTKGGRGARTLPKAPPSPKSFLGRYRPANTRAKTSRAQVFARDPDRVDRGLRGHNVTQELLADAVRSAGFTPHSSTTSECDYDLAWENHRQVTVVEVKSLTNQNERLQLRLGLGQVLQYAFHLQAPGWKIQPVLAVEREPRDARWKMICERHGVKLVWPGTMAELFD